jgi:hypothetical protein
MRGHRLRGCGAASPPGRGLGGLLWHGEMSSHCRAVLRACVAQRPLFSSHLPSFDQHFLHFSASRRGRNQRRLRTLQHMHLLRTALSLFAQALALAIRADTATPPSAS